MARARLAPDGSFGSRKNDPAPVLPAAAFCLGASRMAAYNDEMRKALIDKIFFLDKVQDATVFADFGCADGIPPFIQRFINRKKLLPS
jgi:hypothetical protein